MKMAISSIVLSPKEARVMLLIDSTFKYDDLEKARKLNDYIKERNVCQSDYAQCFAKKFDGYCKTGMVGAACPICNSFAEGKGRLLCKDCVGDLENIANLPQETPKKAVKPKAPVEKKITVHGQHVLELEKEAVEEIKTVATNIVSEEKSQNKRKDYYVIKKRHLYASIAAAVAMALIVNFVVAFTVKNNTTQSENGPLATVEEPLIPTAHE